MSKPQPKAKTEDVANEVKNGNGDSNGTNGVKHGTDVITEQSLLERGEGGIADLLDSIMHDALEKNASDIHFEPHEDVMVVRYRIDGLLQDILKISKEVESSLVFKIKIAAKLRTDEHFSPQDGRLEFIYDEADVNTRISILPTTNGEKVVVRLLTSHGRAFGLEDLGIKEDQIDKVKKNYMKPYGMIVAAGPTGSGKTTTLYSILKILNSREVNILTIEDPVEYDIDGISHVQVNNKAGLTFATGLRSLLRQDPDIIMVGEIRDAETAKIAVNAAMTGHLVLSTIHTNDAVTTVPRFIDMGVEPYLVASTLNLVAAQRLARKLCQECRKKTTLTSEMLTQLSKFRPDVAGMMQEGETIWEEAGCAKCGNKGTKGRIGLFEIFEVNEGIRDLIAQKNNADVIFKAAVAGGLVTILQDGVNKVRAGEISLPELIRVTALRE